MTRAGRTLHEAFAAARLVTRGPLATNDNGWVTDRDGELQLDVNVEGDLWAALELAHAAVHLARVDDNPRVLVWAQLAVTRFEHLAADELERELADLTA